MRTVAAHIFAYRVNEIINSDVLFQSVALYCCILGAKIGFEFLTFSDSRIGWWQIEYTDVANVGFESFTYNLHSLQ